MTDPRWLPEVEDAIAQLFDAFPDLTWASSGAEGARWVLGFLAAAGYLAPPGGVIKQEWSVFHSTYESVGRSNTNSLEEAKRFREQNLEEDDSLNPAIQVRTVVTWPDGAMYLSSWRDVPDD
jgi:hypothetical protein